MYDPISVMFDPFPKAGNEYTASICIQISFQPRMLKFFVSYDTVIVLKMVVSPASLLPGPKGIAYYWSWGHLLFTSFYLGAFSKLLYGPMILGERFFLSQGCIFLLNEELKELQNSQIHRVVKHWIPPWNLSPNPCVSIRKLHPDRCPGSASSASQQMNL